MNRQSLLIMQLIRWRKFRVHTGVAVADPRNGPQLIRNVAPAAGRVEPGVHDGHVYVERHHAAHHGVGQPDRPVHHVHEPAAALVAGHHHVVGGQSDAVAGAHRRHRRHDGHHRRALGQGRQRVRRQFQRQRVQHGRRENAGFQPAQEERGVRVTSDTSAANHPARTSAVILIRNVIAV